MCLSCFVHVSPILAQQFKHVNVVLPCCDEDWRGAILRAERKIRVVLSLCDSLSVFDHFCKLVIVAKGGGLAVVCLLGLVHIGVVPDEQLECLFLVLLRGHEGRRRAALSEGGV